jgi:hypothetical protein
MAQMILHQGSPDGTKSFLHGRNLHEYVSAIAVFLHEALQPTHLPLDPAQSLQVRRLDFRIDGHRLPRVVIRAAAADCHGSNLCVPNHCWLPR